MSAIAATSEGKIGTGTARLVSLDVFRGATIAGMILVNNAGGWPDVYAQLRHARWHGWTFTDTIFPSFLWIAGVSLTLSLTKRLERGDSRARLLLHALRRALIIFALGLLVYEYPHFDIAHLRVLGVLQRIAICYFIASAIFLYTGVRAQAIWTAGLLAAYWILVKLVPVPGHGAGIIDTPNGSLPQYVDLLLLRGFLYTPAWDPEGIVSTIPAIATTLFGVLTGHLLRSRRTPAEKTAWMFAAGNALLVAGAVMNIWLPINKNLWTSSFAVFMAGVSSCAFAFCYWVVDVQAVRRWSRPFAILGMNAIAVYMLAELGDNTLDWIRAGGEPFSHWLFVHWYAPVFGGKMASLAWGLSFDAVLFVVAWALYRRKWFIKV